MDKFEELLNEAELQTRNVIHPPIKIYHETICSNSPGNIAEFHFKDNETISSAEATLEINDRLFEWNKDKQAFEFYSPPFRDEMMEAWRNNAIKKHNQILNFLIIFCLICMLVIFVMMFKMLFSITETNKLIVFSAIICLNFSTWFYTYLQDDSFKFKQKWKKFWFLLPIITISYFSYEIFKILFL